MAQLTARATPGPRRATRTARNTRTGDAHPTLLGLRRTAAPDIIAAVRQGLPYDAFEQFLANSTLSSAEAAALVDIPTRTLSRRKQAGRLQPDESDRLLRAARILGRALALFEGDTAEARQWLSRPQRALAGATPLDVTRTEVGALAVERLIDQLEHGVFV